MWKGSQDCSPFDIDTVYRVIASFTDAEKFRFIESVWKPDLLFEFPASKETCGKQRKFRQEWLVKYPWLVYSKYLDGAFCLPCVCFGMECGRNGAKLDKLFRSPLTFWTTARGKFDSHTSGKSEIHKFSVETSHEKMLDPPLQRRRLRSKGRRSGESTRPPPKRPGFKFRC